MKEEKIKLSIGFPVYNGEKYLKNRLDSILSQTFKNFELIISDNASDDDTQRICMEFVNKDQRIRYHRQTENIGMINNFKFVLKISRGKYFVWASVDDVWESEFLKSNIDFLESHNEFIASISNVSRFGKDVEKFNEKDSDSLIYKIYNKFRRKFRSFGVWTVKGSFEKKVRIYLRSSSAQAFYSIFRRKVLQKSIVEQHISGWDMAVILNSLKYGDLNVLNDTLIHFSWDGFSRKGIQSVRSLITNENKWTYFFPQLDFTKWCWKNLGRKNVITNLDYFVFVNLWSFIISVKEYFRNN